MTDRQFGLTLALLITALVSAQLLLHHALVPTPAPTPPPISTNRSL